MTKEKFLSFYIGTQFLEGATRAWEAVEKAYTEIFSVCPCCKQTVQNYKVSPLLMAATLGTIRTEIGRSYNPSIKEIITPEKAERNYGGRKDLGNDMPGDVVLTMSAQDAGFVRKMLEARAQAQAMGKDIDLIDKKGGKAKQSINAFAGQTVLSMGKASAMAWVLFMIIMVFSIIMFRTSARWVYYGGEK